MDVVATLGSPTHPATPYPFAHAFWWCAYVAPPTSHDTNINAKMYTNLMSTLLAKLEKELFSACENGDVDRVRRVIAAGVDPEKKAINVNNFGLEETPLHAACRYVVYM